MTIHVLHAGDGYLYLTRSVAAQDEKLDASGQLASYYVASGQPPGTWAGHVAEQLDVRGAVTEGQMKSLFGEGRHPDAEAVTERLLADGESPEEADRAVRLGRRYPVYGGSPDLAPTMARAYRNREAMAGRPLSDAERLETRQRVAADDFRRRHGRPPIDPVELDRASRATRAAVAGYDFVFTPVKSVSVLWALGSAGTRSAVYAAHRAAVADAIDWLERNAAFTRTGTQGQAQIDTTGVIAAAFDHWDSRAGDPDLHTHVAVSNKVRGTDGRWRSLDGRALFAAAVSLSERYNTRIEDELRDRLGLCFVERAGTDGGRRSVREIDGVPTELISLFSKRRQDIEREFDDLRRGYRARHGRDPSPASRLKLYQQATLTDRPEKERGRSLQKMIVAWQAEAEHLVGPTRVSELESLGLSRPGSLAPLDLDEAADDVLALMAASRSTWTIHHVRAEAQRRSRATPTPDRDALVEGIVAAATGPSRSLRIEAVRTFNEPPELRRADGESVFVEHATTRFTTNAVLDAEQRVLEAARAHGAAKISHRLVESAVARAAERGRGLNVGQRALVRAFCLSGRVAQLGLAPAGAGKTTAMRAVTEAWGSAGFPVVALAPSAAAADVLSTELRIAADTVAKFDHDEPAIAPNTMILLDEAGMAGTIVLDRLLARARAAGAVVRMVGDDQQLGAVEAGGVIRLIAHDVGCVRMQQVVRFADPAEARATLQVREGCVEATEFYRVRDRLHAGTSVSAPDAVYEAWRHDVDQGNDVQMLAASSREVSALNSRARADLVVAGRVDVDGPGLRDGNVAGRGDRVTTRRNERLLLVHAGKDWVKNGDSWIVERTHDDGCLTVRHRRHRGVVTLPAEYVRTQVELDYARTIRRAQGLTVDRTHLLVDPGMAREDLYVGLSRARHCTHLYVAILTDPGPDHRPDVAGSAAEVLDRIITRSGVERSAAETVRDAVAGLGDLRRMAVEYEHAIGVSVGDRFREAAERIHPGLTEDVAWPSVVQRLHLVEARGWSVAEVLNRAERMRDWTDARSATEVMSFRLDRLLQHEGGLDDAGPVPGWLAPQPPPGLVAPWDHYLPLRYREMSDRLDALVEDVNQRRPAWCAVLGHGQHRADALREVVSYRTVYDIQVRDPLGPEPPGNTRQHQAWASARRAIDRSQARGPASGADRLLAELTPSRAIVEDHSVARDYGPTRHR